MPLDPADFLPAELPMGRAVDRVVGCALRIVATQGGPRVLLESDFRFAWQDRFDPERPVGELVRDGLVFEGEGAAIEHLRAEPQLPAVVLARGGHDSFDGLELVERELPRVTTAVVMAGGLGTRLRPLTEETPKPLLDVAGRPLMFRILELLHRHGVRRVFVSVNYLGEMVRAAVGDGGAFGVTAHYLEEREPLGTGAGLAQLHGVDEPFYVINGDILTDADLVAMARQHRLARNLATVATYLFPAPLPYGLVHRDGQRIASIEEKPVFRYPVNAGIYVFSPDVLRHVERGRPLAMVDFLNERAAAGDRIGRFALIEYWNDVGSHADYERAQRELGELRRGGPA